MNSSSYQLTVEREMTVPPDVLYRAWTERFDSWFAVPGSVRMTGTVDEPFYFATAYQGTRQPHYGRFLRLDPDHLVELTWLTGAAGTKGAETVVTVELEPHGAGAVLRLTHAGFADQESRDLHEQAWPLVLTQLDERMATDR